MSIYTKKGDKGKTSLVTGKKVWKSNVRVEAYGTIDELNAILGEAEVLSREHKSQDDKIIRETIKEVMDTLFYIGSYLAGNENLIKKSFLEKKTKNFEKDIDSMTEKLPLLNNFILPGGTQLSAKLHHARAVSRRAERSIVGLMQEEELNQEVVQYINRLSDLLFTAARFANYIEKRSDIIWKAKS